MRVSDSLQILSQTLNFAIFIYFAIILIKTNPLDILNIIISYIGILISLIVSIIEVIGKLREE